MPWLKSDDKMPENDKIWSLSDFCYRLYDGGRFFAARKLTDGHVPADRISSLTPKPATKSQIEALVSRRLWHRLPGLTCKSCIASRAKKGAGPLPHNGYLVHDFLEFNPSRAQWTRDEEQRKAAGRVGAQARWGNGEPHSGSDSGPHSESHGEAHPPEANRIGGSHATSPENDGEPHGEMHAPYPVSRTPRPGSTDPVPAEDPFEPDAQEGADRSRDQVRAGRRNGPGLRHVGDIADEVLEGRRPRAAS